MCSGCIDQATPEKRAQWEQERDEREAAIFAAEQALPYDELGISPPPVSGGDGTRGHGPGTDIRGTVYENDRTRLGGRYSLTNYTSVEDAEEAEPEPGDDPETPGTPLYRCSPDSKPPGVIERNLTIVDDEDGLGQTVLMPDGGVRRYRYALNDEGNVTGMRRVVANSVAKG